MIEDSMLLLLDVDDIDRMFAASGGYREDEGVLRQRRSILMEGLAGSLHLPDSAVARPLAEARLNQVGPIFCLTKPPACSLSLILQQIPGLKI